MDSSNSSSGGGVVDIPPYTPPPMLSPVRPGSGLFCKTPLTPSVKFMKGKHFKQVGVYSPPPPHPLKITGKAYIM